MARKRRASTRAERTIERSERVARTRAQERAMRLRDMINPAPGA